MFQIYSTQRTQYTMHKSYEFPNPNLDLLFLNSRRSHLYREIHKGYCFPATETLPNNQSSIKSRGYEVLKLLLACRSFLSPSLPLAPPTPTLHRADRHGRHGLTRKGAGHCRREDGRRHRLLRGPADHGRRAEHLPGRQPTAGVAAAARLAARPHRRHHPRPLLPSQAIQAAPRRV